MKEHEIRPKELLEKYIELGLQDAKKYFSNAVRREMPCVACGSQSTVFDFEKYNFAYDLCNDCGTLYQTPRPSIDAFELFYRYSKSSRFWSEIFFPAVAEKRRKKIFKPRAKRLTSICKQKDLEVTKMIDVGAGYGIFLDEWRKINPDSEAVAVEPMSSLANECRKKGFFVVEEIAEQVSDLNGFADLVVCFEVLEHVFDPLDFVRVLKKMTRPGGYVFISTLCIDGFDLQILWEKSSQISPPHHINFLSLNGFKSLFERAGLTNIQLTTPGQLDVDIVRNNLNYISENSTCYKFLNKILNDKIIANKFQKYLAENQLSSHVWVIGKK